MIYLKKPFLNFDQLKLNYEIDLKTFRLFYQPSMNVIPNDGLIRAYDSIVSIFHQRFHMAEEKQIKSIHMKITKRYKSGKTIKSLNLMHILCIVVKNQLWNRL
jgi:hypothetical protein